MKKIFTPLLFLLLFICFSIHSNAQVNLPGIGNSDVKKALEKVIADYQKDFATLKGEVMNENPQSTEYASLLVFKTAEQNSITKYSGKEPVYSWQAQMLTTESYSEAAKKYKSLYKDLKNTTLKLNIDYSYGLEGQYSEPDEGKKFATTSFHLVPNATYLPKVKVELALQFEFPEWKVLLQVYQKEREDNERGETKE